MKKPGGARQREACDVVRGGLHPGCWLEGWGQKLGNKVKHIEGEQRTNPFWAFGVSWLVG